jgi:hypothetical protein
MMGRKNLRSEFCHSAQASLRSAVAESTNFPVDSATEFIPRKRGANSVQMAEAV